MYCLFALKKFYLFNSLFGTNNITVYYCDIIYQRRKKYIINIKSEIKPIIGDRRNTTVFDRIKLWS